MENRISLLKTDHVDATPKFRIKIPTVGEILEDEQSYYSDIHALTAVPYQYMVQLDDMGIDYTTLTDFDLFMLLFPIHAQKGLPLIFSDLDVSGYVPNIEDGNKYLYNDRLGDDYKIDEFVYMQIVSTIRKINDLERVRYKPANDEAKRYLLEKERRKLKRNARKPYEPYLEKLVIALVNKSDFKYDYDSVMDLSIYKFNSSFKQISTSINYDNTMIGVYTGNIDTSKISDKSCLSWIPQK